MDSKNLKKIEIAHSSSGALPLGKTTSENVYLTQFGALDARKGEAHALETHVDPLLRIRALIFRGQIAAAKKAVKEAALLSGASEQSGEHVAEYLLEAARIAAYEADWQKAYDFATESFRHFPSSVSRLTLHQIRAVAAFELGLFREAGDELGRVESLATLFPHSPSGVYARILKAKIIARDQSPLMGLLHLKNLWKSLQEEKKLDLDNVLSLIRVEIDIRRQLNFAHLHWTAASYALSEALGDELFSGLAIIDMYLAAGNKDLRSQLLPAIRGLEIGNPRIQEFTKPIFEDIEPAGTSARDAWIYSRLVERNISSSNYRFGTPVSSVVIPSYRLILKLNPFEVLHLSGREQFFQALQAVSTGSIPKSEFFKKLWGNQKYVPELHDSLIRSTLHKIRTHTCADIRILDSQVVLLNALVVEP